MDRSTYTQKSNRKHLQHKQQIIPQQQRDNHVSNSDSSSYQRSNYEENSSAQLQNIGIVKIEEKEEMNYQQQIQNEMLPNSIYELVKTTLKNLSESELKKILDQLISKHPDPDYASSWKQYPLSSREAIRGRPKGQKNMKIFVNTKSSYVKRSLYLTLMPSQRFQQKVDILLRTSKGEIIFYAENMVLDDLSKEMIQFIYNLSQFRVIENKTPKSFIDYSKLPFILEKDPHFAWCQYHDDLCDSSEISTKLQKLQQLGYIARSHKTFFSIFPFETGVNQISEGIKSQLMHLKALEDQIDDLISHQCPGLKVLNFVFLKYLLMNAYIIENKHQQNHVDIKISSILEKIINTIMGVLYPEEDKINQSIHYPVMLDYPKQCLVCKKDAKQAYPPVERDTIKKTKYGCQRCKQFFKFQIRLCVKTCFHTFHDHMAYYISKSSQNIMSVDLPPPCNENKLISKLKTMQSTQFRPSLFKTGDIRSQLQICRNIHKMIKLSMDQLEKTQNKNKQYPNSN